MIKQESADYQQGLLFGTPQHAMSSSTQVFVFGPHHFIGENMDLLQDVSRLIHIKSQSLIVYFGSNRE